MKRVRVVRGIEVGACVSGGRRGKVSSVAVSRLSVGLREGERPFATEARRRRSASGMSGDAIVVIVMLVVVDRRGIKSKQGFATRVSLAWCCRVTQCQCQGAGTRLQRRLHQLQVPPRLR